MRACRGTSPLHRVAKFLVLLSIREYRISLCRNLVKLAIADHRYRLLMIENKFIVPATRNTIIMSKWMAI